MKLLFLVENDMFLRFRATRICAKKVFAISG